MKTRALKQIINHYGLMKQLKYIHSEYFELDEAIIVNDWAKNILDEKEYEECQTENLNHIAEEIADVMVMLKQFQYYFDISDAQIERIMNTKIDRQKDRIKKEKANE